jgi:hypothetical protein
MSTSKKIAAATVVMAISLVALALILGTRPGEKAPAPGESASIDTGILVTEPGALIVDYLIDLDTGVMTPLPEPIIRSVAKSGNDLPRYAASSMDPACLGGTGDDGALRSSSPASTAPRSAR